jgi:toxin HigB-1
VIRSFAGKTAEDIFHGADTREARKLPKELWGAAKRKLDMLNAAADVNDLRVPPGNRLEKLKGDRSGQHSIRINDQFRICFVFSEGSASEVEVVDDH